MSVYLLMGLVWALIYRSIFELVPASFRGVTTGTPDEFIYFSFVTLATLGYGDITPVQPLVRTLVYLEAVAA